MLLRSGLAVAITSAFLFMNGCRSVNSEYPHPSFDLRAGVNTIAYEADIGKGMNRVPANPDDVRELAETTVSSRSSLGSGIDLEGNLFYGDKDIRLGMGLCARYNFSADGLYRDIRAKRYQNTDIPGSNSIAFTSITPDRYTFTPLVKIENSFPDFRIGFEYGIPFTGFDANSGRDRRGRWEAVEADSWNGSGNMVGMSVDVSTDNIMNGFSVSVKKESYKPTFNGGRGRIESYVISFGYNHRF